MSISAHWTLDQSSQATGSSGDYLLALKAVKAAVLERRKRMSSENSEENEEALGFDAGARKTAKRRWCRAVAFPSLPKGWLGDTISEKGNRISKKTWFGHKSTWSSITLALVLTQSMFLTSFICNKLVLGSGNRQITGNREKCTERLVKIRAFFNLK